MCPLWRSFAHGMRIQTRSIVIMFSKALAQASTIALAIILVRIVDQEVFGTYRQLILVFTTVSSLLSLQLEASLFYYVPKISGLELRSLAVQTTLFGLFASAVSALVIFFGAGLIAEQFSNPDLVTPLRVMALYPLTEKILILAPTFMISVDRVIRASVYSLVASVGRVIATVAAFATGASLTNVVWAMVGISALVTTTAIIDMIRLTPAAPIKFDKSLVRGQLSYCLPLFATALVGVLNIQYDKLLIVNYFKDAALYGVYSNGAMELPVVVIVTSSVTSAIMPNLVSLVHAGKLREAIAIWQEAARKCSFVILTAFAFLLSMPGEFMVMLYGIEYAEATWPFLVYLMILPIRVTLYASLLRAAGDTRSIAVIAAISMVLNVILSTVLIFAGGGGLFSFMAPSIGTFFAIMATAALLLRRVCAKTGVPAGDIMRWGELSRMLLLALAASAITQFVPTPSFPTMSLTFSLAAMFVIRGFVFAILMLVISWISGFLNPDEKRLILAPITWISRRRAPASSAGESSEI